MDRVKYYELNDLTVDFYLKKASDILQNDLNKWHDNNINSIIELYNILRYLKKDELKTYWLENLDINVEAKISQIEQILGRYFSALNDENFIQTSKIVDNNQIYFYNKDYLDLITKYNVHKRISQQTFKTFIRLSNFPLNIILQNEKIVKTFPEIIKMEFESDPRNIELYITEKTSDDDKKNKYYFPKLTSLELEKIINNYIKHDDASAGYLSQIATMKTDVINLSEGTKYNAKIRKDEIDERILESASVLYTNYYIDFSEEVEEIIKVDLDQDKRSITLLFDNNWLNNNLDYPTILQNFISLFGFVDGESRMIVINHASELGTLERTLLIPNWAHTYKAGQVFQSKNDIQFSLTNLYIKFLSHRNINIEVVIQWFFEEYLKEEFEISNFTFTPTSETSTYEEKNRFLFSEIDRIKKQLVAYESKGKIEDDFIQFSSFVPSLRTIKSLNDKKYIYNISDKHKNISRNLFGDQMFIYDVNQKEIKNYINQIYKGKLEWDNLNEGTKIRLNPFIEANILVINEERKVTFIDKRKAKIYYNLYKYDFISYHHKSELIKQTIDNEIEKGNLKSENTLLSQHESDYFSFLFDKEKYTNGLELRNKYIHGSNIQDKEEQSNDYIRIIASIINLVIKINDDLCLYYE